MIGGRMTEAWCDWWIVLDLLNAGLTKRHMGHMPQALFRTKQNRPKVGPKIENYAHKFNPIT